GREESERPFDLDQGPLLRTLLLRLAPQRHVVALNLHHIVADGWSLGVLRQELAELYRAFSSGEPSPLPELPVQYADFALWQRRWLTGEVLAAQIAFWRQRLAGAPPALELPTDRPRSAIAGGRGDQRTFTLPADLSAELERLGRISGATPFMVLVAAFAALLARITGQEDVVLGSPIANRRQVEIEGLIGFFANTLVLRNDLQGDPPFVELVARTREATLDAYAHQDLPFEKLVEELQPERHLERTPIFQVAISWLNDLPPLTLAGPGLDLASLPLDFASAKFDLTLALSRGRERLSGELSYRTELFDAATIARFLEHLGHLLRAVVATPEERLYALPLLGAGERQALLYEWNDTQGIFPETGTLHGGLAEQAACRPDAVALVFEGEAVSYRELERRASQLARRLRALGVGPEVRVGISAERSVELVVGLFAVLKAGGAYVPLDPSYPAERLAFMLADAQVAVLLAAPGPAGDGAAHAVPVLRLDAMAGSGESAEDPAVELDGGNLAYVIYTSGSTGRPKGAMNTHAAIANRLHWMQAAYGLSPADVVLQKTPMSFDVSVWEFFWPLAVGARLVVALPGGHRDAAYLVRRIQEEGVTTLHFVPSMLQAFLEEPGVAGCRSLRRVIASGEALLAEHQDRFAALLPAAGLHNLYGPTEAAVDVSAWTCEPGVRPVPIGRPIANLILRVLDRGLQPAPIGVPGELRIGGVGLARGYHRSPDLTASRFLPDPLATVPGARLYATGDLVRQRTDGALEYLGRLDHQVKLRGFRIELGEIESVLREHPAVTEAAVVLRREKTGDAALVAYAVPDERSALPVRRWLRLEREERLTGYERRDLPNGMAVVDLNRSETEFLYREIFVDRGYLRHGISLEAGACVFDVGANIGLFSLFVGESCPSARIYAFEPIPPAFDRLRINTEIHGLEAHCFPLALGEAPGRARFTYFPHISILSGRYADATEEA
ncbi:MAG TPA: amino acid adenylation domain-containing protein, partial [Thermoanaerobaculia bacterium]|nr:amino acid adenylation domain-containing protein [Thermoanaerobaculia bacterium]